MRFAFAALVIVAGTGVVVARESAPSPDVGVCRDIQDSLLRLKCFDDVSKLDAPRPAASKATPAAPKFRQYAAELYRGPVVYPDFRGRERAHAMYRTRIREGVRAGANFAGHLALVPIGCGAGCVFVPVVDVQTGRVLNFPLGGEEQMSLDMKYQVDSRLVAARYIANERCKSEEIVWTGSTFQRGASRDLGGRETCYAAD